MVKYVLIAGKERRRCDRIRVTRYENIFLYILQNFLENYSRLNLKLNKKHYVHEMKCEENIEYL